MLNCVQNSDAEENTVVK